MDDALALPSSLLSLGPKSREERHPPNKRAARRDQPFFPQQASKPLPMSQSYSVTTEYDLAPACNLSTAGSGQIPVRRRLHLLPMTHRRVVAANALETPIT
jgi:hypothetical protein